MRRTERTRYLLTSTALLLLVLPGRAPGQVTVGATGGLSFANVYGDDVDDDATDARTGFLVGGFVSVPINDVVSLTPGLYYAQKGATDNSEDVDLTLELSYLEVPLLLQIGVAETEGTALGLFLGPAVSFEVGCSLAGSGGGVTATVDCDSDEIADFDIETTSVTFGAVFGAGLRFATSESMSLLLNGGVDLGLTSIDDSPEEGDVKNRAWFAQAGVGWVVGG